MKPVMLVLVSLICLIAVTGCITQKPGPDPDPDPEPKKEEPVVQD